MYDYSLSVQREIPFGMIVDVGGGTGAMIAEVLRAHPHVRGILVDQPGTIARAGEALQASGVAERVTTVGRSEHSSGERQLLAARRQEELLQGQPDPRRALT